MSVQLFKKKKIGGKRTGKQGKLQLVHLITGVWSCLQIIFVYCVCSDIQIAFKRKCKSSCYLLALKDMS